MTEVYSRERSLDGDVNPSDVGKKYVLLMNPDIFPGSLPSVDQVEVARRRKAEGNVAFQQHNYVEAIASFSKAILYNPFDHLLYSNRSACWAIIGNHVQALDDAQICVLLNPGFAKGYGRKGLAEFYLGRWTDAKISYEAGLVLDPGSTSLEQALQALKKRPHRPTHMILFAPRFLDLEQLFEQLEDPEGLTDKFVQQRETLLNLQLEYLTQTLHLDYASLMSFTELRDVFDQATFACGQLLSFAPAAVSRLKVAPWLLQGLGCVLRVGWSVNHGVAKFAANALCELVWCERAEVSKRRLACQLLLGGMVQVWSPRPWLRPRLKSDPNPDITRTQTRTQTLLRVVS
jgi:tetratricopeptide (TPR) repeat protein